MKILWFFGDSTKFSATTKPYIYKPPPNPLPPVFLSFRIQNLYIHALYLYPPSPRSLQFLGLGFLLPLFFGCKKVTSSLSLSLVLSVFARAYKDYLFVDFLLINESFLCLRFWICIFVYLLPLISLANNVAENTIF